MKPVLWKGKVLEILSPPARGRGLKLRKRTEKSPKPWSPPARGRGLKRWMCNMIILQFKVAPRAGAWIETLTFTIFPFPSRGRPPRGGVD